MTSEIFADANITFDVFNEKDIPGQDKKQCVQIGTATLNLHQLLEFGHDLVHQDIAVRDRYTDIGTLFVSVSAISALQDILSRDNFAVDS